VTSQAWTATVSKLLDERMFDSQKWRARCAAGIVDARRFDALEHARRMIDVYKELLPGLFRRRSADAAFGIRSMTAA
jgi:hypothetical protein